MIAKVPTKTDDEKSDATTTLKENSLKAAGWAYLIGDATLCAANMMEGDRAGAKGAALWSAGSIVLLLFGNPGADRQLKLLNQRLGTYLKKQGVEIPKNPTTAELAKEGGVIEHILKFFYAYPSQILNTLYAVGGASIAKGGFEQGMKTDFTKGALVTAGGLAGLLIPEKPRNPKHSAHSLLGKTWEWAQEKPLRVAGTFYHLNNVFAAASVYEKWKQNKNNPDLSKLARYSPYVRFLNVASFIVANVLLGMSSKEHGGSNEKDNQQILAKLASESAAVVVAQPKEVQETLVQNIAGYLSAQPEIKKTAPEIAELLHVKLGQVREALPVAGRWQSHVQKGSPPQLSPSV